MPRAAITEPALPLDGAPRGDLPPHSFDWLGLAEPSAAEMEAVRSQFGLHPLAVEDALNPNQMPKVEIYGQQLFIVARTAAMEEGESIGYGQTALFLGRDFLITVRFGSTRAHNALRAAAGKRCRSGWPKGRTMSPMRSSISWSMAISRSWSSWKWRPRSMEERAINVFPEQSTIRRIFRLRRQLRRFQRIVGPMEEVCERLTTTELPTVDPGARIWFRDVLDHVRRTMARVDGLKETLASVVETASLLEAHRQGEITRQLAAWAAILAVPTAIAGIYGMNFDVMPELRVWWGYPAVLGVIGAICGGLFVRFRRIGWV